MTAHAAALRAANDAVYAQLFVVFKEITGRPLRGSGKEGLS